MRPSGKGRGTKEGREGQQIELVEVNLGLVAKKKNPVQRENPARVGSVFAEREDREEPRIPETVTRSRCLPTLICHPGDFTLPSASPPRHSSPLCGYECDGL